MIGKINRVTLANVFQKELYQFVLLYEKSGTV